LATGDCNTCSTAKEAVVSEFRGAVDKGQRSKENVESQGSRNAAEVHEYVSPHPVITGVR
jgi:hypothetical protein